MELDIILQGDALDRLAEFPEGSIQCIVTSPPYYKLRDYKMSGQIGLENTPELYIEKLVRVFSECRRVLKKDGTLWVNIGDSYATSGKNRTKEQATRKSNLKGGFATQEASLQQQNKITEGLKAKDLIGIPWLLAFALRADGWYLRQDIIWSKPNTMPESVKDRCTKSHEYLFMLSKSKIYYYDHKAIQEPAIYYDIPGMDSTGFKDAKKFNGKHSDKQRGHSRRHNGFNDRWDAITVKQQCSGMRNKRDVWEVATSRYKEAHFATFPELLIVDCIKAGSKKDDVILDPFIGSGTTAITAMGQGRHFIGIELNPEYVKLAQNRIKKHFGIFSPGEKA